MESGTLDMLGKCSATKLYPQHIFNSLILSLTKLPKLALDSQFSASPVAKVTCLHH